VNERQLIVDFPTPAHTQTTAFGEPAESAFNNLASRGKPGFTWNRALQTTRRRIRRLICLFLALLALSLLPTAYAVSPQAEAPTTAEPNRLLVHQMLGVSITPRLIRDNLKWIETNREFIDGVILFLGDISASVMQAKPLSYETVASALAPVKDLNSATLKYNFALVFSNKCADPFDDWSICIQNWGSFARAVKDTGLEGIAFDNEEYFEHWTDYPSQSDYPNKSLAEYQAQTRLRGQQVMEAIIKEFPDIELLFFVSPSISEPKTPARIGSLWLGNYAQQNELMGPFFAGFLEGLGTEAVLIDGGAQYKLRYPYEFEELYEWRKYGMASDQTNSAFIPSDLRPAWRERVDFAFGIYNLPWQGRDMTPDTMGPVLFNALNFADRYAWLYIEYDDLVGPNAIEQDWVDWIRWGKQQYTSALLGTQ
jgi:hypothetical protein